MVKKKKSLKQLRQQFAQSKTQEKQQLKKNAAARRKIEELKENNESQKGIPVWLDKDDDSNEGFEKYLLKSNISKKEKERRINHSELSLILSSWSLDELSFLWDMREDKLSSAEDAAFLLARIRFLRGIDQEQLPPSSFYDTPEISRLKDSLGFNSHQNYSSNDDSIPVDSRKIELVRQTVRQGQSAFRNSLISHYGLACMVSRNIVGEIIEAAHISPYSGLGSNSLQNGLLLRVDFHRLFDRNLMGINPVDLRVYFARTVEGYEAFSEMRLQADKPIEASRDFLEMRWEEFRKAERSKL